MEIWIHLQILQILMYEKTKYVILIIFSLKIQIYSLADFINKFDDITLLMNMVNIYGKCEQIDMK